jgi:hypothetical protein
MQRLTFCTGVREYTYVYDVIVVLCLLFAFQHLVIAAATAAALRCAVALYSHLCSAVNGPCTAVDHASNSRCLGYAAYLT